MRYSRVSREVLNLDQNMDDRRRRLRRRADRRRHRVDAACNGSSPSKTEHPRRAVQDFLKAYTAEDFGRAYDLWAEELKQGL